MKARELSAAERKQLDFMAWFLWNRMTPDVRRIVNGFHFTTEARHGDVLDHETKTLTIGGTSLETVRRERPPWPDCPQILIRINAKEGAPNA